MNEKASVSKELNARHKKVRFPPLSNYRQIGTV
jgi:hypothetical protein